MNTIFRLFAALAVAVGGVLAFAPLAPASTAQTNISLPPGVPDRLPIKDQQTMLDWIVSKTNELKNQFGFSIMYTRTNGTRVQGDIFGNANGGFNNYQEYLACAKEKGKELIQKMKSKRDCMPDKPVYFVSSVHYDTDPPMTGFLSYDNIGTIANVDEFAFNELTIKMQFVVVRIPGLKAVKIDVGGGPRYSWYSWSDGITTYSTNSTTSIIWPGKSELSAPNLLNLNPWYCTETNRTRIKILVGDRAFTYTQGGDMILPPVLKMNAQTVKVSAPIGADVIIETSTDLKNWEPINPSLIKLNPDGSSNVEVVREQYRFYRASCN